jgi:molybdate transport system substrate-binding protein
MARTGRFQLLAGICVVLLSLLVSVGGSAAQSRDILIFAAASLKNAVDEIGAEYQRETGKKAVASYAASSALARQIEAGAPADIFISADLDWMNYLQTRGLVRPDTRATLLANRIVLIGPKDSGLPTATIEPGFPLIRLLGGGRLAMGDTSAVPAGKYGKAALQSLGVWDTVKARIAQAESVRAALALVSRGEAPLGIVYRTDAAAEPNVRILGTFPESTHPPILYPVAILAGSAASDAPAFLAFLRAPAARTAFEREGFVVIAPQGQG